MKVWQLLSDESKWTKGFAARSVYGAPIDPRSNEAVCWCLVGAIARCYGDDVHFHNVRNLIADKVGRTEASWNDTPKRTYSEVYALVKELDI